jgi:dolichol-phosphate mannosyltransferase
MINSLTLIIPIYNEEKNIQKYLGYYIDKLNRSKIEYEIILVESNSNDLSRKKIETFKKFKNLKIYYENKKKGYGSAIKLGLINSSKKFIVTFPIDNQYSISDLIKICLNNSKNVITYRKSNETSIYKKFRSLIFKNLCNGLFNFNYQDINSLKIIDKNFLLKKEVFANLSDNWAIDLEILILLSKYKIKSNQIGINLRNRKYHTSKVNILDIILMFFGAIKARLKFSF